MSTTKERQAEKDLDRSRDSAEEAKQKGAETAQHAKDAAKEKADDLMEKGKEKAREAGDRADDMTGRAGEYVSKAGEKVREKGPQEGAMGKASAKVAGALDSTGEYLQEKGLSGMAEDLTETIRKHPIPAVLVGIGIGFLMARATRS